MDGGNCNQVTIMVEAFMKKYHKHIFKVEPFQVQEIDTDLVQEAFRKGEKSAAGMDSWEPEEFALMSRYTCAWCARLYQTIEKGAEWPEGTRKAKAVFLEKEGALPG